ncbi:DUF4214 domain-containing protein [Iamia sp. SCSIO 61187]|uniref:DUF4214 domain-containing protein n=1 Tax=Iamia sp. SCSIO 61187 TaxID=2722752 RepID=UPI001C625F3F|nr:DUF4214 domain-containing protein [Iamia sp. SCSIO 61187]QYG93989.1 DUF4214 domain-containing protein [Iamia sp. SCSIO 61187]
MSTPIRHLVAAAVGILVLATSATAASAYPDSPRAAAIDGTCEGELRRLHDQARATAGLPPLREDPAFDQVSRAWAANLARTGTLAHNPSYVGQIARYVPDWQKMTENVGYASTASRLHQAYMDSPGHRANILDRSVQRVGIGCVRDANGRMWSALNFVDAGSAISDRRPTPFRSAGDASSRLRWWLLAEGPSAAEVDSDAAQLLRSWSAADLAVHLAGSSLHDLRVPGAARLYGGAFDRTPDAPGLNFWVQRRQMGWGLPRMANYFATSSEFQRMYGELDDRAFVLQVYRNVLDREADAGGANYWVGRLRDGATRGDVLLGFTETRENREATLSDTTVSWAFAQMLGRVATDVERTTWTTNLELGTATPATLVRWLAGTNAFAQRVAAGGYV